jgi:hypothetical protein
VDRDTVLWTLVVFFGASVLFGLIASLTEDESPALRIGVQAAIGLLLVAALVAFVRRSRR